MGFHKLLLLICEVLNIILLELDVFLEVLLPFNLDVEVLLILEFNLLLKFRGFAENRIFMPFQKSSLKFSFVIGAPYYLLKCIFDLNHYNS